LFAGGKKTCISNINTVSVISYTPYILFDILRTSLTSQSVLFKIGTKINSG